MSDILIQQAALIHQSIYHQGTKNLARIQYLKEFIVFFNNKIEEFIKQLQVLHKEYDKKIRSDTQENYCVVYLNQYMNDNIKDLTNLTNQISSNLKTNLIPNLESFINKYRISNDNLYQASLELFSELESNSKTINQIHKRKSSMDIQDEELNNGTLLITNNTWAELQLKYKKLLEEFDFSNQTRCIFVKNMQIQFIRTLSKIFPSSYKISQNLAIYQKYQYVHKELEQTIITNIQKKLGRSQLLRNRTFSQIFIKLQNDHDIQYKNKIQSYTRYFLTKSCVFEEFQQTRNLILQQIKWSAYFLENLCSRLYTSIDLPLQKYNEITTMIKFLFVTFSHQQGQEKLIYNLLYIGIRISLKDKLLIRELSKYQQYWMNQDLWKKIHNQIKEKINKKAPKSTLKRTNTMKETKNENLLNKGLKKLGLNNKQITKQFKNDDQKVNYDALRQVNIFISKLQLKSELIVKLVVNLSNLFKIGKNNTQKLILYHYYNRKNDLNKWCNNTKSYQIIKRDQNKLVQCIKISLIFLPIEQYPCRLRMVCKKWDTYLRVPLYQRYLKNQPNLNVLSKLRINLYKQIITQAYDVNIYAKMISEIPKSTEYTDLIRMDVKRSLSWDINLQPKLNQILVVFSFYNQKIGYLQGMNYIGQNIFKLGADQWYNYAIFDYIMINYFKDLFKLNFEELKLHLYQFNRLMEINLPILHKHFENQKVQGEHYLVAWAITLWGQLKGDIVWILWDGFIIDGWKWWIKVGIWVLSVFEAQFLEMRFEQLLKFFSELSSNQFFNCKFNDFFAFGVQPLKIKEEINKIKVDDKIMKLLEQEYTYSKQKCLEFIKQ